MVMSGKYGEIEYNAINELVGFSMLKSKWIELRDSVLR